MQNKITRFLFFFLSFLLIFQFFNRNSSTPLSKDDVVFSSKDKITIGKLVSVTVQNNGQTPIVIEDKCPQNSFLIERRQNGEWIKKEASIDSEKCQDFKDLVIEPSQKQVFNFGLWSHQLFSDEGQYRIVYELSVDGKQKMYSHELEITPPSLIKRVWNTLLYRPIFNTLFYFIAHIPGYQLGWAIILLTLLIKLILLVPNQKALKAQRQMQLIQPQLDALKKKHKDNPSLLAQETMEIWKKNKVSPMGSCLPMLIQFPILIALFYVVRDGLSVVDPNLFYEPLKNFDSHLIDPVFLGLINLTQKSIILLPLVVGGLQFVQIRLSFGRMQNKNQDPSSPLPMMNQMMQYVMPIMIAVFTASLPAAVGFYWGTSTLFSIGQQFVVNRDKS